MCLNHVKKYLDLGKEKGNNILTIENFLDKFGYTRFTCVKKLW